MTHAVTVMRRVECCNITTQCQHMASSKHSKGVYHNYFVVASLGLITTQVTTHNQCASKCAGKVQHDATKVLK